MCRPTTVTGAVRQKMGGNRALVRGRNRFFAAQTTRAARRLPLDRLATGCGRTGCVSIPKDKTCQGWGECALAHRPPALSLITYVIRADSTDLLYETAYAGYVRVYRF